MKRIVVSLSVLLLTISCRKEVAVPSLAAGDSQTKIEARAATEITEANSLVLKHETDIAPYSNLISNMRLNKTKIAICLIGDSTGNEEWEWFYLFTKWLLSVFPNYVVEYHKWSTTDDNYGTTVKRIAGSTATSTSPVLIVYNGSRPGATIGLLSNRTRVAKFLPPAEYQFIVLSCSHNDGADTGSAYISKWRAFKKTIRSRTTKGQIIITTQNPEVSPSKYISQHAARRNDILAFGTSDSIPVVDVYKDFYTYTTNNNVSMNSLMLQDGLGVHPNTTGETIWANKHIAVAKRY